MRGQETGEILGGKKINCWDFEGFFAKIGSLSTADRAFHCGLDVACVWICFKDNVGLPGDGPF